MVENDKVASEILKAKVLRERVTFMPINKMRPWIIPDKKVQEVTNLTNGTAKLAIELIEYDHKLEPVMR